MIKVMILTMMINITFKITVMKNNSIIWFMEIITSNINSHNNNRKTLEEKKPQKQYF